MTPAAFREHVFDRIADAETRAAAEDSLCLTLTGRDFRSFGARYTLLAENPDRTKTVGYTLAQARTILARLDAALADA